MVGCLQHLFSFEHVSMGDERLVYRFLLPLDAVAIESQVDSVLTDRDVLPFLGWPKC